MIVFDLQCEQDHRFEAWFASSAAFDDQRTRDLVACPYCTSVRVEKAVMSPRISTLGNGDAAATLAKLAGLQRRMLEGSTWVGDGFAGKARAMAEGTEPAATIHGTATVEESKAMREDGVAVMPLLFPVVPPEARN